MLTVSEIVISIDILDSWTSTLDTLWINNDLASHAYLIVKIFHYCTFDIITETVWFLLTLTVPLVLILRSSIVHWRCIWHFWSATHIFHQLIWTKPWRWIIMRWWTSWWNMCSQLAYSFSLSLEAPPYLVNLLLRHLRCFLTLNYRTMFTYSWGSHACRIRYHSPTSTSWLLLSSLYLLILDSTNSAIFHNFCCLIYRRNCFWIFYYFLRYCSTCVWVETLLNIFASIELMMMLRIDRATVLTSISITCNKATCVSETLVDLIPIVA